MTESAEVSDQLRAFIKEAPAIRAPLLAFMQEAAADIGAKKIILDVGSGKAPFRELFTNRRYIRLDWNHSIYEAPVDVWGSATILPIANACVDAVICTEVLEHVSEPLSALTEIYRVLKPLGKLWLTTPFVWPLHEEPYDYYRYTSHGLRHLLEQTRFQVTSILPSSDAFSTLAEMAASAEWLMGRSDDAYGAQRGLIARVLKPVASMLEEFSSYDAQMILPLGYRAVAIKAPLAS